VGASGVALWISVVGGARGRGAAHLAAVLVAVHDARHWEPPLRDGLGLLRPAAGGSVFPRKIMVRGV
jgi:hypothetical protein